MLFGIQIEQRQPPPSSPCSPTPHVALVRSVDQKFAITPCLSDVVCFRRRAMLKDIGIDCQQRVSFCLPDVFFLSQLNMLSRF